MAAGFMTGEQLHGPFFGVFAFLSSIALWNGWLKYMFNPKMEF